jgi:hypothetical protein
VKLLRLATVVFQPDIEEFRYWSMRVGPVNVSGFMTNRTDLAPEAKKLEVARRLLQAEIPLRTLPSPDAEGFINVPEPERRACERAIEAAANVISVLRRTSRSIASPWPPVAFVPESDEERKRCAEWKAIRYQPHSVMSAERPSLELEAPMLSGLSDRLDGLESIATLIAQTRPLGRYREAVRFFEMAFALPIQQSVKKLSQFLASGRFGHSREEVASWFQHRHGAVHGDRKITRQVTTDADVARYLDRIELAAYDVLFNKKTWHDPSRTRRSRWKPTSGSGDNRGTLWLVQGSPVRISCTIFDGFGAYQHDLGANLKPPPEWWCPLSGNQTPDGDFPIRVRRRRKKLGT